MQSLQMVLAQEVIKLFSDIRIAFGESDEYSFVLHKSSTLYGQSFICTLATCILDSACLVPALSQEQLYKQGRVVHLTIECLYIIGRRSAKLISVIVSAFTASFVQSWGLFFPNQSLQSLPIFDARSVCYPSDALLRDYLSWRQADTHINNQVSVC